MKLILEPTTKIVEINGVPCRIWQGQSESGLPCHAHIALVGVDRDADAVEFDRELMEREEPRADIAALPLRLLMD